MELNIFTGFLLLLFGLGVGWLYTIRKNSSQQVEQNKQIIKLLKHHIEKQNVLPK